MRARISVVLFLLAAACQDDHPRQPTSVSALMAPAAAAAPFAIERRGGRPYLAPSALSDLQGLELAPVAGLAADPQGDRWLAISSDYDLWALWLAGGRLRAEPVAISAAASQAAFSFDGRRVALVLRPLGWSPDLGERAATLAELDVASRTRLVVADWPRAPGLTAFRLGPDVAKSTRTDYNPRFLPDGRLLFTSLRTGLASFFLADLQTGVVRQLTNLDLAWARAQPGRATPVALTDALLITAAGHLLYTTRPEPDRDELWILERPGGPGGPAARRLGEGALAGRLAGERYAVRRADGSTWMVDGAGRTVGSAP